MPLSRLSLSRKGSGGAEGFGGLRSMLLSRKNILTLAAKPPSPTAVRYGVRIASTKASMALRTNLSPLVTPSSGS